MAHVVDNATPKTKANFIERCKSVSATSSQHPEDQSAIVETFFPSTVGRPTKEQSIVRKALFTVPQVAAQAPKSAEKSQRKTKSSSLHISKPQQEHQAWRRKVQAFYERDDVSRVMPNKRDVVTVDGDKVAKCHLLQTKRQIFNIFKMEYPEYLFQYTTFIKAMPKHVCA